MIRILAATGMLCLSIGTASAQDKPARLGLESKGLASRASASIEVVDTSELRLYDTMSFYVRVSLDKAAPAAINISNVDVTLQGPAAGLYSVKSDLKKNGAATADAGPEPCQLTASSVEAGESAVVATCVLDRSPMVADEPGWLVIRPKVDAFVTVTIEQAGEKLQPIRVTTPIALQPPLYAPYLGGCVGAFALAVLAGVWRFRTSRRLLKARVKFAKAGWSWRAAATFSLESILTIFDLFVFVLSEWGFASITAFVFIVLGQGTSVAGAPIQLTVTNFWGGVTVGLLAFPLNKWLLERLGLTVPKAKTG